MDSLTIEAVSNLKPEIVQSLDRPRRIEFKEWEIARRDDPHRLGGDPVVRFTAVHKNPHIFVVGDTGRLRKARFEVPEVLHGFNGRQIKNQFELDAAMTKARAIISELCVPEVHFEKVCRIDVAFNVRCNPAQLLAGLQVLKHPWIRRTKVHYQGNAVQFIGEDFALSIYCKSHRRCSKRGIPHNRPFDAADNHLRIEVQARTRKAVERLYDGPVGTLDFEALWKGFRFFLSLLPEAAIYEGPCTLLPLLKLAHENGLCLPCGKGVLDWWKENKKAQTITREMRQMAGLTFHPSAVNLVDLIPSTLPTEFLDVMPDGSTEVVLVNPSPTP